MKPENLPGVYYSPLGHLPASDRDSDHIGHACASDIKINAQGFNEGAYTKATASEIRFTQTKKYLYATVLAWPEEKQVVIQSLATGSELYPDKITKIELLGYGKVSFTRTAQGVVIDMPDVQLNKIAPVFKIKK